MFVKYIRNTFVTVFGILEKYHCKRKQSDTNVECYFFATIPIFILSNFKNRSTQVCSEASRTNFDYGSLRCTRLCSTIAVKHDLTSVSYVSITIRVFTRQSYRRAIIIIIVFYGEPSKLQNDPLLFFRLNFIVGFFGHFTRS